MEEFKPKFDFYHIIKDGESKGRIMAAFYLFKIEKGDKIEVKNETQNIIKKFKVCNFEMPIIGVRNLPNAMEKPVLTIRIPQPHLKYKYWEKSIELDEV